jgi:uncharacterized tellurite resistance protein B-like protein
MFDAPILTTGSRELIARLAAAVMIADGHVTEPELSAVDHLRHLGLGPFAALVEEELERAMNAPIDVPRTAVELARLVPEAGTVILSALAQIAASDRQLSRRELEVLSMIAEGLGISGQEAAHVVSSVAASYGATLTEQPAPAAGVGPQGTPVRAAEPPRPSAPIAAPAPRERAPDRDLGWALGVLGLDASASPAATDEAYAALVRRYNPAVVLDLGPEFAVLAVQKLNAVTTAYVAARAALSGH